MFINEETKCTLTFILSQGNVDLNEIYLQATQDKTFLNQNELAKLIHSKFIGYGYFERYQHQLLDNYRINKGSDLIKQFQQEPTQSTFNDLVEELTELKNINVKSESSTKKFASEYTEDLFSNEPSNQVKTHFNHMDFRIGGFDPSQLVILAARPSVGKTSFALNMLWNVAKNGYKTSFFSLETTGKSIIHRLVAIISGIDLYKIKNIKDLTTEEISKITNVLDQILKNDIDIHDDSAVTTQDIRAQAMKPTDKPQIIFVDYLQLMQTDTKLDRRLGIEKISRDLKIIANNTGNIIVLLSQLSRAVEQRQDKRPMLSDLKEAGGIEADASLVFMLYRDDYYNEDMVEEETGRSEVECNIAKNKDGERGVVKFDYYKKSQRFFSHG
ncbi:damage-inducible protein [Staphylococcus xylosus]|nr:damage-inducible protein [Staphylococcus xylosus]